MTLSEALGYATDTAQFVTGKVLEKSGELFKTCFGDSPAFFIADENTYKAAGFDAERAFLNAGLTLRKTYLFPGSPPVSCEYENARLLAEIITSIDAIPVAVGSGTINDLVKVAAYETGIRYMNIATAASVDGFSAPGASMIRNGFKNSIYCLAPLAIVADRRVLTSAPAEMAASGYADLAGKYTAGADWLIADALGEEPVDSVAWRMVHEELDFQLEDPAGVSARREDALEKLFFGLTMSGLAMQYLKRSRPASGLEHAMSHIWEMEGVKYKDLPVSHGFKVAIGTLASAALTECIFERDPKNLKEKAKESWVPLTEIVRNIRSYFDEPLHEAVIAESRAKHLSREKHAARVTRIIERWDQIRTAVFKKLPAYKDLRQKLRAAGAPVIPGEIGIDRVRVAETYRKASYIRNRYTNIDLALDLGILDECVDEIMKSDTYLR